VANASAGKLNLYLAASKIWNRYSVQYSAGIQQQLGHDLVLNVDAQFSHTMKQPRVTDINHPAPFIRTAPNQIRSGSDAGCGAAATSRSLRTPPPAFTLL
jgi:hypothetical protein